MNDPFGQAYSMKEVSSSQEHKFERVIPPELLALINKLQTNYSFFSDMEEKEVGQFLKLCHRKNFKAGDEIFDEGDSGDDFYLVVSGEIAIRVGGKEVARMGQGAVFGEMAMLDNAKRTASAVATQPSLLFSITRNILSSRMPKFANKVTISIARQLSDKLRDANGTIKTLQKQLEKAATIIKRRGEKPQPGGFADKTPMRR